MINKKQLFEHLASFINRGTLATAKATDNAIHYARSKGVGHLALGTSLAARSVEQACKKVKVAAIRVAVEHMSSGLVPTTAEVVVTPCQRGDVGCCDVASGVPVAE